MKWHKITKIISFAVISATLMACDGSHTGRDIGGTILSYSEPTPLNPAELVGNLSDVFSGAELVNARYRIRNNSVREESVNIRNKGIIVTERFLSPLQQWSAASYEIFSYQASFKRQVERENASAKKLDFLNVIPLRSSAHQVNGFVADVSITLADGRMVRCAIVKAGYGERRQATTPQQINRFEDIRIALRGAFCGGGQNARDLERQLQRIVF